jgi:S-(hydroxymethyl)glutathione dehydrogenase/alcohol dehydrogenase
MIAALHCRAAVLHKVGAPLVIEEIEITGLGANDVLVRVGASGLCHTDLEVIEGQIPYPLPVVLGHEGAGTVAAVGGAVTLVRPGDKVICSWNPNCGHCFYCDRDQPILCESFTRNQPQGRLLDGGRRLRLRDGELHHFSVVSSHAEYCVVPESGAVRVPKEIPDVYACLIGCGVMTGVGAVCRFAKVPAGSHVAVLGCGAVGLNAVQGAVLQRAASIVAVEPAAARRVLALRLGATHAVDPEGAPDVIHGLTAGRGADYVFECAGAEASLRASLELARPGAEIVILGKVNVDRQVSFRWGSMMGERRITRSSYGGARPRRDFPWLAQLFLDGQLDLKSLVTEVLPLERINDGFDAMRRGETIRSVIEFPA